MNKYTKTNSDYIVQTIKEGIHLVKHYDFINKLSAYTIIEGEVTLSQLQAAKLRINKLFDLIDETNDPYVREVIDLKDMKLMAFFGDESTQFIGFDKGDGKDGVYRQSI